MQQRILRLMFFMLAMLVFTGLVSAQPRPASSLPASRLGVLSGLAAYVPGNALFYASARSDAEALAALNAVAADITASIPDVMPPAPLEGLIGDLLGVPYSEIDAWLGEGMAIAGLSKVIVNDPWSAPYDYFAVIQTSDAAAAEAFLAPRMGAEKIVVLNDILLLGEPEVLAQVRANSSALLDEPAFVAAIDPSSRALRAESFMPTAADCGKTAR